MGTIDFQQLILSTTKQKRSFSSSPPFSLPAYLLIQTLKPKLSHGWLTLTMVPMEPVSMVLGTTVMLLDIVSLARDLLTPTPMLKLSHGWLMDTTDTTTTLEPDTLDMLVHTAADMLLHTPTPDTDGKQKVKWSKKLTNKF